MQITVKKNGSPVVVTVTTKISPVMIRLCPAACVLTDDKGNQTFKVGSGAKTEVSAHGFTFARAEGAKDEDFYVANITEDGTLKSVKEKYAAYLEPLTKVEAQLTKAYSSVEKNLEQITEVD